MITCVACGRPLAEDSARTNYVSWTYVNEGEERLPYCADSLECALIAYRQVREGQGLLQ